MITIKILFTINSLEKREKTSFKTLFTIPFDLKSTQFSVERVNLTKKNYWNYQPLKLKSFFQIDFL